MVKKGPYTVISSKKIYHNPWIEVTEEKVIRDNGQKSTFGLVNYGSGVSVAALNKYHEIYLVKEYYYAIESYGLQLPSGGIDKGESALDAAKRELKEETGLIASDWKELGYIDPLTMIIKSPAYLFLATGVGEKDKITDDTIELVKLPFAEAHKMVMQSRITHGPTCVAILKIKEFLKL